MYTDSRDIDKHSNPQTIYIAIATIYVFSAAWHVVAKHAVPIHNPVQ